MRQASIFNIQRYSLHDGGGIRSIVFFKGCPFHCPWCCNPESLSREPQVFFKEVLCMNCSKKMNVRCTTPPEDCPTGAKEILGKLYDVEEIYDIVKRDMVFYESSGGGVTLSGGECLWQLDFAIELLKKCKEHHIHTAIETTLALPLTRLDELVAHTDVFLVDFKIMDEEDSQNILGLKITLMKENVKAIMALGGHVIARIPLIPTFTATKENLIKIKDTLQELHIQEVHLLPFHQLGESKYKAIQKTYSCSELMPFSEEEIEQIHQYFKQQGLHCVINGN